ncbi:MAG: hypothetical protein ABH863_03585 [Candidatus Micrarchaeota archaeon]
MMDLLKKLLGGNSSAKPQDKPEKIILGLMELQPAIERRLEERLAPFYKDSKVAISEIMRLFGEIGAAVEALSKKPIQTENPQYEKIAKQMKVNYFARIPKILEGTVRPERADFPGISKFHEGTLAAMAQLTKITSDNRYLMHFYKEEFEALGEPIRALAQAEGQLGKAISGNAKHFNEAQKILGGIKESEGAIAVASAERERELNLMKRAEKKEGHEKKEEEAAGKKLEELQKASSEMDSEIAHLKTEIASLMLPLGRPLRKFERIAIDKKHTLAAAGMADDHLAAMRNDGKALPALKSLCAELEKMLMEGKIEEGEKDKAKHLEILRKIKEGETEGILVKLEAAEGRRREFESAIGDAERKVAEFRKIRQEEEELGAEISRAKKENEEKETESQKRLKALEARAGAFLGREVEIKISKILA